MANGLSFGGAIPAEIAANLKEFLPEFGDLDHEELLQHQECVFQSLKGYDMNRAPNNNHVSNLGQFSDIVDDSTRHGSFDQLELDEAFARSLQMVDDFDDVDTSHLHTSLSSSSSQSFHSSSSRGGADVSSRETSHSHTSRDVEVAHDVEHDDIDPDNMSYEQLQSLGEAVGSESRGLPDEVIDSLPSSKYKTGGMFFRKKEKEECVICCMPFESGDRLISLTCSHQYHSKCIKRWLQEKKNCPVCQTEVSPD